MMPGLPDTLSLYDAPEPLGGAEADIFRVRESNTLLVKLFRAELTSEREALIRTLCDRAGKPGVAWPYALRRFHQRPGLVLPKVAGQELHVLTSRSTRLAHFPRASWHLAITAARNYAQACAAVHAQHLAVVDVSARNALIDAQGTVTLIDVDSFLCPGGTAAVATEEYQSPETLGRLPMAWQIRYDLHGIALILFELLFHKASPWRRDANGSAVHFRFRRGTRDDLKPWEPGLDDVTAGVADLFVQAFGRPPRSPRPPRASEWAAALTAMERLVRPCPRVPTHAYVSGEGRGCPWCACAARPEGHDVYRPEGAPDDAVAPQVSKPVPPAKAVPPISPLFSGPVRQVKVVRPAPHGTLRVYLFLAALLAVVLWISGLTPSHVGRELVDEVSRIGGRLWRWVEDPEDRDWRLARAGDFATVETFLETYSNGGHVTAARTRLAELATGLPLGPAPSSAMATIKLRIRDAPSLQSGYSSRAWIPWHGIVHPLGSVRGGRWLVIDRGNRRVFVAAWKTRPTNPRRPEQESAQPNPDAETPDAVTPPPEAEPLPAATAGQGSALRLDLDGELEEPVEPPEQEPPEMVEEQEPRQTEGER